MERIYFDSIDSTNSYAKNNIENIEDKTIIYTYNQTNGYGRLNRQWLNSVNNNLYISFVLKPFLKPNEIYANFTQYLSVVLAKLLEKEYNLNAKIKWPNDVLVNNKKIAGILAESSIIGNKFNGLVLGAGINLNTSKHDILSIDKPATSIYIELGRMIDKDDFLKKLYNDFFLLYDNFIKEGFESIKNDYIKRASFLNCNVSINVLGNIHTGIAKDITDNGSLILVENNNENTYFIGDIL